MIAVENRVLEILAAAAKWGFEFNVGGRELRGGHIRRLVIVKNLQQFIDVRFRGRFIQRDNQSLLVHGSEINLMGTGDGRKFPSGAVVDGDAEGIEKSLVFDLVPKMFQPRGESKSQPPDIFSNSP